MSTGWNVGLMHVLKQLNVKPKVLAEIGVGNHLGQCMFRDFFKCDNNNPFETKYAKQFDCSITLVEARPSAVKNLQSQLNELSVKNVTLHNKAIFGNIGTVDIFDIGPGGFVRGYRSYPHATEDTVVKVDCCGFDKFDPGNIDVISIDIEGCEIFALKTMISRPKIINLECGEPESQITNNHLAEIEEWMKKNGYIKLCIFSADTVYVRKS